MNLIDHIRRRRTYQGRFRVIHGMIRVLFGTFLVCCLLVPRAEAQQGGFQVPVDTVPDIGVETIPKVKANLFAGRPGKAALFSLILPGAGQAYNGKYWQVPIVWAGVGAVGYVMLENSRKYRGYSDAYREHILAGKEGRPVEIEPGSEFYESTAQRTRNQREIWNRNRQLAIIGFTAVWIANSAQAFVSAHLLQFDIDDNLSLQIIPVQQYQFDLSPGAVGPAIVLYF